MPRGARSRRLCAGSRPRSSGWVSPVRVRVRVSLRVRVRVRLTLTLTRVLPLTLREPLPGEHEYYQERRLRNLGLEPIETAEELDALRAESMRGGEEAGGRAGGRRYEGDIDW